MHGAQSMRREFGIIVCTIRIGEDSSYLLEEFWQRFSALEALWHEHHSFSERVVYSMRLDGCDSSPISTQRLARNIINPNKLVCIAAVPNSGHTICSGTD